MRFVPSTNVRTRLVLTFLVVIVISWVTSTGLVVHYIAQESTRLKQQVLQGKELIPPSTRHLWRDHPMVKQLWQVTKDNKTTVLLTPFPVGRGMFLVRAGLALLLSFLAAAWLSRHFTRPLSALEAGAQAYHDGDFTHRVDTRGHDEFARVSASMNEMAQRVSAHIASLEADARRRQQFLADVAHELRSPVANLRTMAEALRDGVAEQPERRALALETMVDTTTRLQGLITDLLELARLDMREFPLHKQRVDARALAREVLEAHRAAAEGADITLHPVAEGSPLWLEADPHRLAQVLTNLLTNAIRYGGHGSEVRIILAQDEATTIRVEDNGRGIPEEHLPYIFEPFYRADAARTPGDTHSGLGLRIARGIVEEHGGTLTVDSNMRYGTKVTITLPREEQLADVEGVLAGG